MQGQKLAGWGLALALTAACASPPGQSGAATGPALQKGFRVEADGKPIDGEIGHLVPCVTDWNNDGKKDLIVGQFGGGKIALYLNQGTDAAPVFSKPEYLKAGGAEISLPAG
ncbi:MAG TPA: VCBS repeat-containing protein [Candidatus Sumerlaeota bacterium]|nr:VCBS repeat-containing protein [Candidatus Sumerlaeota bacterium]HPS01017.1 VCBS repeat-containing protein [Candidatus Sumerlaeota bacterium]